MEEVERRGINPQTWGPCMWSAIHYTALAYPVEPSHQDQVDYRTFFESLQRVLPCKKCRDNMCRHLREKPLSVPLAKGKYCLFDWTVTLHNLVNDECGKPPYDPQAARVIYESGYGCRSFWGQFVVRAVQVVILFWILALVIMPWRRARLRRV